MTEQTEEITEELEVDGNINADDLDEDTPEIQPWQEESEEEPEDEYKVDGKLHQSMKSKLKGRVSDRDDKIATLTAENEALRLAGQKKEEPKVLTRPRAEDYATDEEHELALSKYDGQLAQETYNRNQAETTQATKDKQAQEHLSKEVDSHYERADVLIKESGIKPENYKKADENLRRAFDTIRPKEGDLIVDQLISKLGAGSEKVAYFLGVNKPAQAKAQSLLSADPSGMSLLVYLGEQKNRLTNPKKPRSTAPDPAANLDGDEKPTAISGGKFKKAYDKAHKEDDVDGVMKAKDAAKAAGVDVKAW